MTQSADALDPHAPQPATPPRWFDSLSARLFGLTLGAILFVEALILVPSLSGVRTAWLAERVQAGRIAALALDAAPSRMVSEELAADLLENAELISVAEMEDGTRMQLLAPAAPVTGSMYDVNLLESTALNRSIDALGAFGAPEDRVLVVLAKGSMDGRIIEIVVPQAPLKAEMAAFARRVAALSLLIGLVAASVIYVVLHALVVRPMQRVTKSVEQFRGDPGSWTRRLPTTSRRDEIGRAQNALSDMESAVADSFRQREHLANLGSAVAKINHDLRNSLASAQLVSDTLARSDDPRVQRAAPRLERALERAIKLAQHTLDYGKAQPEAAHLETVDLRSVLNEAASEALALMPNVSFDNQVPADMMVQADPDHLHRIASNLLKNAAEVMLSEGSDPAQLVASASPEGIHFADTGPGLPQAAIDNLFKPFSGSGRRGGTGLGLVIARELAQAMGGDLVLSRSDDTGAVFTLRLPEA